MAPHPWRDDPTRKKSRPNRERPAPERSIPSFAYVQAYEAQLVYGRASEARQLYTRAGGTDGTGGAEAGTSGSRYGAGAQGQGGSLLRWAGSGEWAGKGEEPEVFADRYDIIHLLSSLPSPASSAGPSTIAHAGSQPRQRSPSPAASVSSWPDADSDEEALFLISDDEELAAHRRAKQRKWMEKLRQDRLREMDAGDRTGRRDQVGAITADDVDVEEDPSEQTLALMHHTALSIARSPNPIQLEAKILAHHAGDARFAFLRAKAQGFSSSGGPGGKGQSALGAAWAAAKRAARVELGLEKPPEAVEGVGMGLGGYESSDEESEEGEGKEPSASPPPPPPPPEDVGDAPPGEENAYGAGGTWSRESTGDARVVAMGETGGETTPIEVDADELAKRAERKAKLEAWRLARRSGGAGAGEAI